MIIKNKKIIKKSKNKMKKFYQNNQQIVKKLNYFKAIVLKNLAKLILMKM